MSLEVVPPAERGQFVCPWCGATFPERYGEGDSLHRHWEDNPICATHRDVNNPTQTKYAGGPEPIHTPPTLTSVE